MRTRTLKTIAATFVAAVTVSAIHAQPAGEIIPDKYIVQLKPGVEPADVALAHGAALVHVYKAVLNGYAGFIPPGLLARVAADPRVENIVPDRVVEAYGKPGGGGGGVTTGETVPEGVNRIGAKPGMLSVTGSGIGIAIVDTGIDLKHADLEGAIDACSAFGGSAQDDNGHGTHVAGIVAARHNQQDVVGVAPEATLYAVKVLDSQGSGSDSDVISGLEWVATNAQSRNIKVANMSLGRAGTLNDAPALHAAIQSVVAAGVTVVVAAGNDCSLEVSQNVPATYPEVIAVASTTAKAGTSAYRTIKVPQDMASYFTTDGKLVQTVNGSVGVTISAPGEDQENVAFGYRLSSVGILSTRLGGGTTRMSGTSMAAPHVAGVVALMQQKAGGGLAPETVRTNIRKGADNVTIAPLNGVTTCYSFDGEKEGILWAPGALGEVKN